MEATYTKWWMELPVYNTCFIKPAFHSSASGNSYLKLSSEGELLACVWFHIEVTQIEEWRWLKRDYISLACCVILTPESQIEFSVHVEVIKESPVWFVLYLPVRTILGVQLYNVQCIMYLVHEIFKLFLTLLRQLSLFFYECRMLRHVRTDLDGCLIPSRSSEAHRVKVGSYFWISRRRRPLSLRACSRATLASHSCDSRVCSCNGTISRSCVNNNWEDMIFSRCNHSVRPGPRR